MPTTNFSIQVEGGGGKGGAAEVETNLKWSEEMLRVCHGL